MLPSNDGGGGDGGSAFVVGHGGDGGVTITTSKIVQSVSCIYICKHAFVGIIR